jgi:outer membrane protein assembly factor BamA
MIRLTIGQLCAVSLMSVLPLHAQAQTPATAQDTTDYSSRAEQIEAERKKKAAQLKPEQASGTERFLVAFKERRILEKLTYGIGGLRARIGAMVTGSGFAAGPEYFRDDLRDGTITFRATTQFSTKLYQLYDVELSMPRLANNRAFFTLQATQRNFSQMEYYGPGPGSEKTGRSNYRLEDTRFGGRAGVKPLSHLRLGATGGLLQVNVGPGTNDRFISTERQYSPFVTPGIDRQSHFLQAGVFAEYDYRDIPGGPRSGGFYSTTFLYNKDDDRKLYSHRRLDTEVQQYIPLFNQRRVIALRGRSELTWRNPGQNVPFYMQPVLGGSNDLRGFRQWRFYRYEVFSGLDMAVFADAGKVFMTKKQLDLHDLEGSYGVGMRFNARNAVFMRIDAGFSHEGFQVWIKFNNVF